MSFPTALKALHYSLNDEIIPNTSPNIIHIFIVSQFFEDNILKEKAC